MVPNFIKLIVQQRRGTVKKEFSHCKQGICSLFLWQHLEEKAQDAVRVHNAEEEEEDSGLVSQSGKPS